MTVQTHRLATFRYAVKNQTLAAFIHDRCAIQKQGLNARTNFSYKRKHLVQILKDIEHDVQANLEAPDEHYQVSFHHFKVHKIVKKMARKHSKKQIMSSTGSDCLNSINEVNKQNNLSADAKSAEFKEQDLANVDQD